MKIMHKLKFDCGEVPYYLIGDKTPEIEEQIGLYAHIAQNTKSKFWGIVLECFAQHCSAIKNNDVADTIAICHFSEKEQKRSCWQNGFFCLPDDVFEVFDNMKRTSADDCAQMNWYLYQSAKYAVLDMAEATGKEIDIEDFEWRSINEILNRQYVLEYPRPSDDRKGFLAENGIKLALHLVK